MNSTISKCLNALRQKVETCLVAITACLSPVRFTGLATTALVTAAMVKAGEQTAAAQEEITVLDGARNLSAFAGNPAASVGATANPANSIIYGTTFVYNGPAPAYVSELSVVFAPVGNGAVELYSQAIKISIALGNGQISGFTVASAVNQSQLYLPTWVSTGSVPIGTFGDPAREFRYNLSSLGFLMQPGQQYYFGVGNLPTGGATLHKAPSGLTGTPGHLWGGSGSHATYEQLIGPNLKDGGFGLKAILVTPPTPPSLTAVVRENALTVSWPLSYTGYDLYAQTNALSAGIGTNWTLVTGVVSNSFTAPVNPGSAAMFYRLMKP